MHVKTQDICSEEINSYWKNQFMKDDINVKD